MTPPTSSATSATSASSTAPSASATSRSPGSPSTATVEPVEVTGPRSSRDASPEAFEPPRLSESPGTPPADPARSGSLAGRVRRSVPVVQALRAWRQLTSMRTALILLFLLALAAIPGSLIPQRKLNPIKVDEYVAQHRTLAPWLDRVGAFDVFASPWFAAVYVLLFVSLIGCLTSRVRWHAKALVGRPPKAPARPARLVGGRSWTTTASPEVVVAASASVLRRRRFRVAVEPAGALRPDGSPDVSLAAERGYLRETGNLVFHVALVVLLLGVGLGSWFGYQGTVLVVTGNGFANTLVSYDQFSSGQLTKPADLPPFSMTLDRFKATYQSDGEPKEFVAGVSYATDLDAPTRTADIRVNHPLKIGDAKIYLIGHGYAPHFVLRDAEGKLIWESYVPCTPRDGMFTSTCTVKIPDTGLPPVGQPATPQQLAFSGVFTPTTVLDPAQGYVSKFPAALAPGLTVTGFVGNLHVDEGIPQNVYALDVRDMRQLDVDGPVGKGKPAQVLALNDPDHRTLSGLPGGYRLEVDGVREFATFQTKSDPYKGWVLGAAIAVIAGLVASLRVRRRRVWVRARPAGEGAGPAGTVVEFGGLARSDAEAFAAELDSLAERLQAATADAGTGDPAGGEPSTGDPPTVAPAAAEPSAEAAPAPAPGSAPAHRSDPAPDSARASGSAPTSASASTTTSSTTTEQEP